MAPSYTRRRLFSNLVAAISQTKKTPQHFLYLCLELIPQSPSQNQFAIFQNHRPYLSFLFLQKNKKSQKECCRTQRRGSRRRPPSVRIFQFWQNIILNIFHSDTQIWKHFSDILNQKASPAPHVHRIRSGGKNFHKILFFPPKLKTFFWNNFEFVRFGAKSGGFRARWPQPPTPRNFQFFKFEFVFFYFQIWKQIYFFLVRIMGIIVRLASVPRVLCLPPHADLATSPKTIFGKIKIIQILFPRKTCPQPQL